MARLIVAMMPHFAVMVPFPVSRIPDVISSAIPVPRPVNIVRPITDPDGDVDCVNGRYPNPAHTKQNGKE
jgi:hypothetical protein